jgi:hypothetical protein
MKDIPGVKVTFRKGALATFGDGELKIIYVFSAISNRLTLQITQSFSHWATAKDASRPEHVRNAALCGVVESLIDLAGELKEAWESIQQCYYGTKVSHSIHAKLPVFVQEAMKRCGGHFAGTGLVSYLRDNFANHNDSNEVLNIARHLDDDTENTFFIFQNDNKYFEFATKARLAAIAMHLQLKNWEWHDIVMSMVVTIVKEVYADIHVVLNGILAELFSGVVLDREQETLKDVRSFSELSGEYFLFLE